MLTRTKKITALCLLCTTLAGHAWSQDTKWSLGACITFALEKNISVQKSQLTISKSESYLDQSKASRLPSLNATARQNVDWTKQADAYTTYKENNSTSLGLTSSMNLYSGGRTNAQIEQQKLALSSSNLSAQTVRESVSLSIVELYLQVLYAKEQVDVAAQQLATTEKQLGLTEERLRLGDASKSDYLQIKSSLASDKLTLANAQGTLAMAKIDLMQMMELPAKNTFDVSDPVQDSTIDQQLSPLAVEVLAQAMASKPQIKTAALATQSAELDKTIARAAYYPTLSLNGGLSTGYSSNTTTYSFSQQLNNQFSPSLGLTLSVPIFQQKQAKTSVTVAKLAYSEARLNEQDTRNQLRKKVEQACTDVETGQIKYRAGMEQLSATEESHLVAQEKYKLGLMNSVDYLFEKNNLTSAQSQMLQAKYNLLFAYKILDFYKGLPLID